MALHLNPAVINQWAVISIVLSGVALIIGVTFIRRGNRVMHMRFMLTASVLAILFLVLYLTRLGLGYEKTYIGPPAWRGAYFALLISHIFMAALNVPLAIGALYWAYKGIRAAGNLERVNTLPAARAAFDIHKKWTRWTVPVWLYVAVTGWVIYLVLGQVRATQP